jgi:hypothetical protein
MTDRRMDGWTGSRLAWTLGALASLTGSTLAAQVGHSPESSPYRDIPRGSAWSLMVGYLEGNGGSLGIGPRNGMTYSLRYDLRKSGFVTGGLALSYMDLERDVLDADLPAASRRSGPDPVNVVEAQAVLQFNLTGGKTWHHVAPFFTAGLGYSLGSDVKRDTSGFQFGNRFSISPGAGFRFFLGNNLNLRFDARRLFWKLKYPAAYEDDPASAPDDDPVITDHKLSDWTSGWWFIGGLSFSF